MTAIQQPSFGWNFDDEELGATFFAGWEITPRFAVEVGRIDFGEASDSGNLIIPSAPGSGLPPIEVEDAGKLKFEFEGDYVNGQYHIPVNNWGSIDLIGGWIFADSRARSKLNATGGGLEFNQSNSSSDNGIMAGAAFTYKLNDTLYLRGSAMYFQLDFDDVIDEPIRIGADLIWDF